MKVARTVKELKSLRRKCKGSLGLVPTMGYLHQGHLSLVRQAKKENKYAAVSIYVNPTQFAPSEDLKSYPRDLERDLAMLKGVGTDIIFIPSDEEMYPAGYNTWVNVRGITDTLEGRARPTHFQGVTTVCNKLFNIVEPDKAYFGQKDAQQALVIRKMVAELDMDLEIVVAPTVREPDGLAMSSRNAYLSAGERRRALVLSAALAEAREAIRDGERDGARLAERVRERIRAAEGVELEYVAVVDPDTLADLDRIRGACLVAVAAKVGATRLIDNCLLRDLGG